MAHGLVAGELIISMEPGLYSRHWNSLMKIHSKNIFVVQSHGWKKYRTKMAVGVRATKVIIHPGIDALTPARHFKHHGRYWHYLQSVK